MHRAECVTFLRWAMPRLGLDWPGFRRCRCQLCKRLRRRIGELGLAGFAAYRDYLLDHEPEWAVVDACCRVTISRFYRDRAVFERLAGDVLPHLAAAIEERGETILRAWCAGCGAGEEPYSLALAWRFIAAEHFPRIRLEITASDIDDGQLARARTGCYPPGSLRELPVAWIEAAFVADGPLRCLRSEYRDGAAFRRQDIRANPTGGPFELILCRNLAFTYFDDAQQREVLAMLLRKLAPGGFLVIGQSERLPAEAPNLTAWSSELRIFAGAGHG